jgi:hypothetical protein
MGISDLALGIELYRTALANNLGYGIEHPRKVPPRLRAAPKQRKEVTGA